MSHSVDLSLGFGDRTYQKAVYKGNIYQPIYKGLIARGYTKLGYGNELPFYENFYAGGYGANYKHDEVGGNALATFGAELILPMPFKGDWAQQIRPALFVEGGQVFDTMDLEDKTFSYDNSTPEPLITQDKDFRYSAGVGMTWYTPIGPISLSYAKPFNNKKGDKTEKVQFQIGGTF